MLTLKSKMKEVQAKQSVEALVEINEAFMVEMFSQQLNWNIKSGSVATLVRQNRKESFFTTLRFGVFGSRHSIG